MSDTTARARALAEQAVDAQAAGNNEEADRLFAEAQQLDPDAVALVLNEHDAALAPADARDSRAAIQDTARIQRDYQADPKPGAYPGSTGSDAERKSG